jgi:hypothetical protein
MPAIRPWAAADPESSPTARIRAKKERKEERLAILMGLFLELER